MKKYFLVILIVTFPFLAPAQQIDWVDVSSEHELPEGLKLFHGTLVGNSTFFAYYYEVDLNVPDIAIRPYISTNSKPIGQFCSDVGAYGAINGGFFSGTTSLSAIVYPDEVKAQNVAAVTRNSQSYPVVRSFFGINADRSLSTEWIYHFGPQVEDIYTFEEPLPYTTNHPNPLSPPAQSQGQPYEDLLVGIGGGPMLMKDGAVEFTWDEEVFWGSGVDLNTYRPRTAVGYTADNKVIMLVTNSFKIEDLPALMESLGCHGAMNLDGGGSTAMALGNETLYYQNRPVPTILAVVHTDSLGLPQTPTFEKVMDTGDANTEFTGSWFPTANAGYWGDTPSLLHGIGSHDNYCQFNPDLSVEASYEVYGWWVASFNRATDTPFIVNHANGADTVYVNQSVNGSSWQYIGTYTFNGSAGENIRVTAGATTNQYVVADAVRLLSYDEGFEIPDPSILSILPVDDIEVPFGTSEQEAVAALAETTTIVDSNEDTHTVFLSWSVESYDGNTAGDYAASGTFALPAGVVQSDPETPLEVHATITVLQDDTSTDEPGLSALKIFPNPGRGKFFVSGHSPAPLLLEVFSIEGARIKSFKANGGLELEINLQSYPSGIYLLRVSNPKGAKAFRLIKE
ncbi:MAG: phosphodiester glycosidase family protein [Bacteroides sp.]|nr:phosphodiester glycosidase family protein [Bacteroides sp.]